ncbi:MAG: alanine--tRNA ligase [Deinococcales bacterium]
MTTSRTGALSTAQIREKYLAFFEEKGHLRYPSHPIPVYDDPTLMFSVAGMSQFKPYFIGAEPRLAGGVWRRVTTAQKCIRIGDIENVGRTNRHCSFFEMMGNFSFDSYFKKEAIVWAWEFITAKQWLGLEPDRIYVTIYKDDNEAYRYWTEDVGLEPAKIHRFDADENFWPQNAPSKGPNGPCGPCSEIYYDRGEAFGSDTWADYATTRESNRFLEIWNLVFPGYNRTDGSDGRGALEDLGRKNIDTGLGLVRVAAVVQGVEDFYQTDDFKPLIAAVEQLCGKPYEGAKSVSHRVIAEHMRMVTITLADGLTFGTGEREYVVRKVMRRASRHAYLLGLKEPSLYTLVPIVVQTLGQAYPELIAAAQSVQKQIKLEEARFLETLGNGITRLEKLLEGKTELSGEDAFMLYDTYGFPLDLTKEIAEERNVTVDEAGYKEALKKAQALARAGSKFVGRELFEGQSSALEGIPESEFVGYSRIQHNSKVVALIANGERVDGISEGAQAQIVLESTPFYAEGGGQVGDSGRLHWAQGEVAISSTFKTTSGVFVHEGRVLRGNLKVGDTVSASVESVARRAAEQHHTATHLLQAALRAVLGSSVGQAGSYVAPERLRFDFTHSEAVSSEDLAKVELLVNRWIQADFPVSAASMPLEEARKSGAMALFGEKYGEIVRVVRVEGAVSSLGVLEKAEQIESKELCGGTHVPRTGVIGSFVIVSEESIKAGVRRIEALCGEAAVHYTRHALEQLKTAARALTTTPEQLGERLERLFEEQKAASREIQNLKAALVRAQTAGGANAETLELGGFKAARLRLEGVEGAALKTAADDLMDKTKADIVVVGSGRGLVVKVSQETNAKGIKAGDLIRKLAQAGGGNGGGSPAIAQAGGIKDVAAALAALEGALSA